MQADAKSCHLRSVQQTSFLPHLSSECVSRFASHCCAVPASYCLFPQTHTAMWRQYGCVRSNARSVLPICVSMFSCMHQKVINHNPKVYRPMSGSMLWDLLLQSRSEGLDVCNNRLDCISFKQRKIRVLTYARRNPHVYDTVYGTGIVPHDYTWPGRVLFPCADYIVLNCCLSCFHPAV